MLKESASRQERWIQAMTNRIIQSNLYTVYVNLYSWLGWFDDIEFIILLTFDTVEFETNLKIVLSLHWFWVIMCGILSSDSFCSKGNNSIKFSLSMCHNTIIMVNQFKKGVRPCEQIFFFQKFFFFLNLHRQFSPNAKRIGSVIQINHFTFLFCFIWMNHPSSTILWS